jgi:hypothetical protein
VKNNGIKIIHTNMASEAKRLCDEGWEPIECSFGSDGSVVGPLKMDHHGEYSTLLGVAVRAYTDHFGALKGNRASFVVTGAADADATFAIAALSGLLPHPSRAEEFSKAPDFVKEAMTKDVTDLAELVNVVDVNPIGVRLEDVPYGDVLLAFNALSSGVEDRSAFHAGVDRWRALLGTRAPAAIIAAAKEEEGRRVATARLAAVTKLGAHVAFVESDAWGFDVWYSEIAPIIVALTPQGNVTIGVKNVAAATYYFKAGGLKNVFPKLGEGWGGREAIGGSPRGQVMTRKEALEAAKTIEGLL